jgi:hypothetical protein
MAVRLSVLRAGSREDGVENDIEALGERNWKNIARNKQQLQNFLKKSMSLKER